MDKEYFATDSTGENNYIDDEGNEAREEIEKENIKDLEISSDDYPKIQVRIDSKRYEIKD